MSRDSRRPHHGGLRGRSRDGAHIDTTDCDARAERAQELLDRAVRWREAHPDAWQLFVDVLLDEADAGRRAPAKLAIEQVRRHSFPSYPTIYSPVSNDIAPVLGRMFCGQFPEAAEHVELRPSVVDELELDWSQAW